jgi:L-serine/L-threonine ammonia-lyase
VVEPACGAAPALVYEGVETLREARDVVVIVCGGAGVTYGQLLELQASL